MFTIIDLENFKFIDAIHGNVGTILGWRTEAVSGILDLSIPSCLAHDLRRNLPDLGGDFLSTATTQTQSPTSHDSSSAVFIAFALSSHISAAPFRIHQQE